MESNTVFAMYRSWMNDFSGTTNPPPAEYQSQNPLVNPGWTSINCNDNQTIVYIYRWLKGNGGVRARLVRRDGNFMRDIPIKGAKTLHEAFTLALKNPIYHQEHKNRPVELQSE
jgi:hypothetical protein